MTDYDEMVDIIENIQDMPVPQNISDWAKGIDFNEIFDP